MIPLDIVSSGFDMVCNGRRVVIFNEGLEVFSFSIMKSLFCFTNVEIIAIPVTGFVNDLRFLRTIQTVLVWKERFDAAILLFWSLPLCSFLRQEVNPALSPFTLVYKWVTSIIMGNSRKYPYPYHWWLFVLVRAGVGGGGFFGLEF